MLTERKDVKCSREGGIWLVRYERESWYFFNVVLQQSRRSMCGTLQDWTIVGEHCGNQKGEAWPCWVLKADIWTGYLSRVRKRERSGHMRDNRKVGGAFCRNASNVQWRRHISTKWNVEAESPHTLEGKLCERKGRSKGKILPLQKKYRRLLE